MKNKGLLLTTLLFFLLVNTSYYWNVLLGMLAFPAYTILGLVFIGLVIALFRQLYLTASELFEDKKRVLTIAVLSIVLGLTCLRPQGLIDFEMFEEKDVLVAEREGAANCMTVFKMKEDHTFREKTVCFGVSEIKGS